MCIRRLIVTLAACLAITLPLSAQDDDDESKPGLWHRVVRSGHTAWESIQPDVFVQTRVSAGAGGPITEHLEWRGQLLLKSEGTFQLHAYVCGKLDVLLDGRSVLNATADKSQWVSGPETALDFGEKTLLVRYSPAPNDSRGLRLFWSSDSFPLEPLPHHLLFHTADSSQLRLLEQAHRELVAFSCKRCHAGLPIQSDLPISGPSLKHVGSGTNWSSLKARLTRTEADPDHGRMPAYGLSSDDADAVLAYLASAAVPVKLAEPAKVKVNAKETPSGSELIKSIGCLACHEWQAVGQLNLFGGGRLDSVGARRSRAWLDQWLRDPAVLNPQHRMPVFNLSDAERHQIVTALIGEQDFPKDNDPPKTSAKLIERGLEVVAMARCAACHEIPAQIRDNVVDFNKVTKKNGNPAAFSSESIRGRKGCVSGKPNPGKFQPAFDRITIDAHVTSFERPIQPPLMIGFQSPSLLERKNCLACHDRDGSRGISRILLDVLKAEPQWQGQTPTLSPPPLTAVGDKLQYGPLAKAIRGEQTPRMPWLRIRMPRFAHTNQEAEEILAEMVAHDHIPPNAPATPAYPIHTADQPVDPQTLISGRELTGGKGFSCIACHALKDYVPKQVALGTRGSDLYRLGDRMRPEFFFRWTRSPLRIIPGVEMPGYTRPHPTLLDGQLDRQLAAIWDALHDPNFTAPTNPAVVEQLWTLQPGDRPRIIRDVFTLPRMSSAPPFQGGDGGGKSGATTPNARSTPPNPPLAGGAQEVESVPRAFAVGFPNGHNVLFDLDRGAVRAWTIGDFARQRTQGKSWFWDLAGVTVAGGMGETPDIMLVPDVMRLELDRNSGREPRKEAMQQSCRLLDYSIAADRVTLRYVIGRLGAQVTEIWQPLTGSRSGWERTIAVNQSQHGFVRPDPPQKFGEPRIEVIPSEQVKTTPQRPAFWTPLLLDRSDREFPDSNVCRVRYESPLEIPKLSLPEAVTAAVSVESVTTAPGFTGTRLPLPRSIMPTAITWDMTGRLGFTSLKGHVYIAKDSDGDGLEDQLVTFAEGLAAPFGILEDEETQGRPSLGFLVAHKPEVLSLRDTNGDDIADTANVVASGWGYTDDYHDWTTGIVRDDARRWYYIGLGSDYAHKNRPANESKWRGRILRFDLKGNVESVASELRYPVGLTITDDDKLFCSDQQGVQNCFNELNYIQLGHRYGVPAKNDPKTEAPADVAAVQVPHPWTRSVNGVAFWPKWTEHPFAGQIVGAEFNHRALVRFSLQEVDGHIQGAVYPLSKFSEDTGPENLLGPIAVAFHRNGDLYVGSLYDSGWLGGLNVGDIVKLTPDVDALPNGIREVRAIRGGFAIEFLRPVEREKAEAASNYKLSGYTRVWGGEYATPDSGRHTAEVQAAKLSADGRTVELAASGVKAGHVYDVSVGDVASTPLWPNLAHYTLTKLPR